MSDAIPLPPRPDADFYRKLAKEVKATASDETAFRELAARWMRRVMELHGDRDVLHVDEYVRKLERARERLVQERPGVALSDAHFFLARVHAFQSWPRFVDHVENLASASSAVARFEAAADAVVAGDIAALRQFVREDPDLVRRRSTREHASTLLHYVAANGFEDWRQRSPRTAVEVATLLLDAGADVNAESNAYQGRSTTLSLTATSVHPEASGVQIELLGLLLDRGATPDDPSGRSSVDDCLANGRAAAAEFLAARGARVGFAAAAGLGRLDAVRRGFDGADAAERTRALAWASQWGRVDVVTFLLERGVPVGDALHWAAYGGHLPLVHFLLASGVADANARGSRHDGTPLDWALFAWGGEARGTPVYYDVVTALVRAGARLEEGWFEPDPERSQARRRLLADPRMMAAVRGVDAPGSM